MQSGGSERCDATDVDFADAQNGFATCTNGAAMISTDGGLTWNLIDTGLQQTLIFARAESSTELFSARRGFFRSGDFGRTWVERGGLSVGSNGSLLDVAFLPGGRRVAAQTSLLLLSEDDGNTWTVSFPSTIDVYFEELHFPGDGPVGFASGGAMHDGGSIGSFARSDDTGASWTLLPFPHGQITAADFIDADHGVVATLDGEFYTTLDRGESWQLLGDVPDGGLLLDLVHRDALHWYGVSLQGCLYETRDAGASWSTAYCDSNGNSLTALTTRGTATVAVGSGGLVLYENLLFRDNFE